MCWSKERQQGQRGTPGGYWAGDWTMSLSNVPYYRNHCQTRQSGHAHLCILHKGMGLLPMDGHMAASMATI